MTNLDIYSEYSNFVTNNKKEIQLSNTCTCIKCKKIFLANKITLYLYSNTTGVCPFCQSDLIIPDVFKIHDKHDKINKWHKYISNIREFEINDNGNDNNNCNSNKKRKI